MPDLLRVSWAVDAGGGLSVSDMLDPLTDAKGIIENLATAQVHHNPGCCAPCRANNNPALVPFAGCEGAKKAARGKRIEDAKAKKQGRQPKPKVVTGCRCTVVLVPN